MFRVVLGTEQKNISSPFLPWVSQKATKGLKDLTPKMYCDPAAVGLLSRVQYFS
jgi:hypothetical protein